MTIYDYPEYYEIAFSFRDIPREARFVDSCIKRFSDIPVTRIFEVGCGPAPHVSELARMGYQYTGLDNNRNMLDYAIYKNRDINPSPEFIEGDMVKFDLARKVDFAFVMLGSLYLNSLEEMNSHFDSLSRVLPSGGLYFLDWCIQFSDPLDHGAGNVVDSDRDGISVESRFDIKIVDPTSQMYEEIWTVNVNDNGRRRKFKMTEYNRAIFPQEFLLFVENRPDFEFVGWWKEWDLSKPIETASEVTRPIALIKRTRT
ncbi:MAG: class I SAM-dependent methyltransferase [Candidatus Zixiibacteriota bacterium]|nr:MAG: class I SAM-dependent methyltransferase [candidate division Zixibacteria bacterium]